jgi:hypothetical protein
MHDACPAAGEMLELWHVFIGSSYTYVAESPTTTRWPNLPTNVHELLSFPDILQVEVSQHLCSGGFSMNETHKEGAVPVLHKAGPVTEGTVAE